MSDSKATLPLSLLCFSTLTAAAFLSTKFGYGHLGTMCLLTCLALATLANTWVCNHLFTKSGRGAWRAFTVFVGSGCTAFALFSVATWNDEVHESLGQARLEYYCASHFEQNKCVEAVRSCVRCALDLDRSKRRTVADNLTTANKMGRQPAKVNQ